MKTYVYEPFENIAVENPRFDTTLFLPFAKKEIELFLI